MSFKLFGPKRDPHTGLAYDGRPGVHPADAAVADDHLTVGERQAAYGRGRADQKDIDRTRVVDDPVSSRDREAAYGRGRADQKDVDRSRLAERRRRKGGFGLFSVLFLIAAVIGIVWLVLAYQTGSFAGGGAVVDRKVAEVTEPAKQAAADAVDRTGQAVQSAGQAVEAQGAKLRQRSEGANQP